MPLLNISSKKFPDGFPDDTNLRVEWCAQEWKHKRNKGATMHKERRLFWTGLITGEFSKNADPGKYAWKAHGQDPDTLENFSEGGFALVGMSQEQWKKISYMTPKNQRPVLTSDGLVYRCQFPGCTKKNTGKIPALLHESKIHYGVDLLKSDDPKADKAIVDDAIRSDRQKIESQRNRQQQQGRPRA
jgi:hypothetical protein